MTTTTPEDIIRAAASVGRDAAEGRLTPAALETAATAECRALFGTVVGESDPLWDLHRDVARQVLALDGIPADELSEWLAVTRQRPGQADTCSAGDQAPPPPISLPSGPHSGESADAAPEPVAPTPPEPMPEPVADAELVADAEPAPAAPMPAPGKSDGYDPTHGWQAGNSRRY